MAPTDADGDSDAANATPDVDLSAQSAGQQSAAASDQPTLSDTNESTDDWLAALDGLGGGTLLGDTSGLPTPVGVDAFFAVEWSESDAWQLL